MTLEQLEQRMLNLGENFCIHIENGKFYQHSYGGVPIVPCITLEELVTNEEESRRRAAARDVARARVELDQALASQRETEAQLSAGSK